MARYLLLRVNYIFEVAFKFELETKLIILHRQWSTKNYIDEIFIGHYVDFFLSKMVLTHYNLISIEGTSDHQEFSLKKY